MTKHKQRKRDIESSSTISDCSFELADTDNSEYENSEDYIAECFNEEEKENYSTEIPFGLHDIDYFDDKKKIKEDDWIIAQFASKKSVKHFDNVKCPEVKFVK